MQRKTTEAADLNAFAIRKGSAHAFEQGVNHQLNIFGAQLSLLPDQR